MADDRRDRSILPLSGKQGDKQAVKTTIVGGQPPGNDRALQTVPVGIEQLLAMAAVDAKFAQALYRERERALAASGVELTATERGILAATPEPALRQMVGNVGGAIPDEDRRAFLGRSAAALLALVGGALPLGSSGCEQKVKGIRADKPPPNDPPPSSAPAEGSRPNPAPATTKQVAPPPAPPTGSRPDRPQPDAGRPSPEAAAPIGGLTAPTKPPSRPLCRGTRPHRPPPKTKGIRPDRPVRPKSRGISPDRPPGRNLIDPFKRDEED